MLSLRNSARSTSRRASTLRGLAAIALAAATVACSEVPSAPLAPATKPNAGLLSGVLGGVLGLVDGVVTLLTSPLRAKSLTRKTPIAAQSATATIGLAGGVITLPGAGLTVVVPPGALSAPTAITVSAPAGSAVWYDFQPHGITFAVPLQLTQDLRNTNYGALLSPPLKGAYMVDGSQDGSTALVTELISTTLDLFKTKATFPVRHFSGYMVSWGFDDAGSSERF
jgi:hypothetical protein